MNNIRCQTSWCLRFSRKVNFAFQVTSVAVPDTDLLSRRFPHSRKVVEDALELRTENVVRRLPSLNLCLKKDL